MIAKCIACAIVASVSVAAMARTIEIQSLPVSPYADTEVSTNIPINKADIGHADLKFRFSGTPTNNLEMAFGMDANTNGVLDAEEIDTRYGWRSGRYFIENVRFWERFDSGQAVEAKNFQINIHLEVRWGRLEMRKVDVSGLNSSEFEGLLSDRPPSWIWRREWNLMRVTRRGTEPLSDWILHDEGNYGFSVRVR